MAPAGRTSVGLTDVGRRRIANEDAFFRDDEMGLYIVADGMGGHAAGEVASQEAVDTVRGMVQRGRPAIDRVTGGDTSEDTIRRVTRVVESAAQAATYMVYGLAQADPEQQGMGTTLSILLLAGKQCFTAQVGDSRIYLVRAGNVMQVTEDHTLVAWQLKQGIISEEEAQLSPHKNVITRAVGSREYVQVDTRSIATEPSDVFIVCSDGLHGYLEDAEIPEVTDLGLQAGTKRFIDLANERGGKDNITAVLVRIDD